jgi:hypothetical protein
MACNKEFNLNLSGTNVIPAFANEKCFFHDLKSYVGAITALCLPPLSPDCRCGKALTIVGRRFMRAFRRKFSKDNRGIARSEGPGWKTFPTTMVA